MSKLSTVCAALAVLLPAPAVLAAPAVDDLGVRIDRELSASYKADGPGATVIVVKDGKTVLRKAYGMADIERKVALAPDTPMRLGSITKQFTSTAILMLADEGRLKLDDDITRYLPDYPTRGKTITIEHLLTHTSGIVSYTGKPGYMAGMQTDFTVGQMIDSFKNDPLEYEPGTRYKYNNSGYFLLGAIIEKVSGLSYDKFVADRIFVPLGMTRSAYEGHERDKAVRATGYSPSESGFKPAAPLSATQPYAAGSLVSTVDDLARWDAAVSSGKLLTAASWQRAFTPYTLGGGARTDYGYGWSIGRLQGAQMISHGGGINGFSTFALRLPAEKVYVAVLSNADRGLVRPEKLATRAAAIAIGKPIEAPLRTAVKIDNARFDAYAGRYQLAPQFVLALTREGERYFAQATGQDKLEIFAMSENVFFSNEVDAELRFDDGAAGGLTLRQNGRDIKGTKLP